jgi:ABC-type branched-subunit amino acid transport system ATPase component
MPPTPAPPMLEVEDLTVGFGEVIIQRNVSFRVATG